ncbi:TonB-dependent receptor plug domain-containing protein [Rudanella paleaurantiibacter]|uniref:TonB-dependent receptor plug domain-containing protein n=1 Tax=Rudanella paleaurantiibacter TaxID=2614655 RepID=A0A7J5TWR8_9BACT|nr:TonB-dependent receptor [Rudanella paleaurantiibacter]KAB7729078.1 TonB-dependent receptor plug domain-containing protein [Rudanella paleaurantiibacter]
MKSATLLVFFFSLIGLPAALAQTGVIRGSVKDAKTKEALIGCTVRIDGTTMGAATDIEGNFTIANVSATTHKLIVSYVSYVTSEIPNVRVESGNTTQIDTELQEEGKNLQEVVVKAGRTTNTEVAVITEIKQLKPIAVGISAQQIQKSQDRDAAAAIRRVPGVSILDNRFVLIRGLGSRYNAVLINDVIAPSTEVETRSFSFDIIPSNILDRMIVYKSGAASLPGDFAGGVVNIYTKRRPTNNFIDAGFTLGYRAGTTGQAVQTHSRGGLSALGLWSPNQTIPTSFPTRSADFNALGSAQRAAYARLLPNSWGLQNVTAMPDFRFALNTGRRFDVGNVQLSNLTSLNYSLTNQLTDIDFRVYENGAVANAVNQQYNDVSYARQARLGLLHNWSARFSPVFTLEWKTLFNQLGNQETVVRQGQNFDSNTDIRSYSQRFENRTIATTQLAGDHQLNELTKLNWIAGYGYSGRWEPDWKRARFQAPLGSGENGTYTLVTPLAPNPIDVGRFYSKLNEQTLSLVGNFDRTLGNPTNREPGHLRAGIYAEQRSRTYSARFYGYNSIPGASAGADGVIVQQQPIETIFSPANVNGQPGGFSLQDGTSDLDSYRGQNTYGAAYVSGDLNLGARTNVTLGMRAEYNVQGLQIDRRGVEQKLVNRGIFSPLPSVNLTHKLTDKHNLRLAYSATVNRPELRELAPFQYFDFNLLAVVTGNTELTTATIQNIDAKWEFYPSANELVSVTGFYKHFTNPIESFLLPTGNGFNYTFINAPSARNYGVEVEVRKGFANSSSAFLQNIQLVANGSLINSRVSLGDFVRAPDATATVVDVPLKDLADRQRPLANQSPYLFNAGVYYQAPAGGLQWNVLYNVYGPRIFAVGTRNNPTIYELPRHAIDLNISKTFNQKLEVRLGIQDILNQATRFAQDFNGDGRIGRDLTSQTVGADQVFRQFRRGQYFTLTGVYTFGRRTVVP